MTATEISVTAACVSTLVSVLTAAGMVIRHCASDARKMGTQDERSRANSARIDALERLQRGER
jgi:hypothetical protein